tara:strand:- start:8991 stop:10193 length:1203 start_codon:yes stop_codon:yes gene_type:complete
MPFQDFFFKVHAVLLVISLLYIFYHFIINIIKKEKFENSILLFTLATFAIPLLSAMRSYIEFGQPILIGILAERGWFSIGIAFWFYDNLMSKRLNFRYLENSFIFLAFLPLFFYLSSILFIDFNDIPINNNFLVMDELRGARFSFQTFFVVFGAIYYLIKYNIRNSILDLILSFTFFSYIFFVAQSRILIVASLFLAFYYYYSFYPLNKSFIKVFQFVLFMMLLVIFIRVINPEYFNNISFLISDTILSLNNNSSADISYGIRIYSLLTVYNFLALSPLSFFFGAGTVSTQFDGGFNNIFGYLYPADIGIIGGVFLYGVFIVIFLSTMQIYYSVKAIQYTKSTNDIFVLSMKYMVIFYLIYLPVNGLYMRSSTLVNIDMWSILFFSILAFHKHSIKNEIT